MFDGGMAAFIPFVVTILAIVFIDLLGGLGIGLVVALIAGRVPPPAKPKTSRPPACGRPQDLAPWVSARSLRISKSSKGR